MPPGRLPVRRPVRPLVGGMRRSRAVGAERTVVIDGFSDLVAIGSGGFSIVYRAHELALDRAVAVKVLNTGLTSERERRDFERECKALGQLNHPDVVTVYRPAFTTDGRPCIVMALYERNFRDQLDATGPLPPAELLDVGIRMAVALHVAHRRGVLHRDVKPHNIFRSVYGDPALGDFGISTLAGERSHDRSTALSLAYVAPEILDDAPPSAQADVYSLAATLHHLATGRAPFDGKEPSRVVNQVLHDEPPPIGRADLPASFERVAAHGDGQGPGPAAGRRPGVRRDAARGAGPRRPVADDAEAGHRRGRARSRPWCSTTTASRSTGVREGRQRRTPPPPPPGAPAVPRQARAWSARTRLTRRAAWPGAGDASRRGPRPSTARDPHAVDPGGGRPRHRSSPPSCAAARPTPDVAATSPVDPGPGHDGRIWSRGRPSAHPGGRRPAVIACGHRRRRRRFVAAPASTTAAPSASRRTRSSPRWRHRRASP